MRRRRSRSELRRRAETEDSPLQRRAERRCTERAGRKDRDKPFDIASLPPIESIDADTDVTAFLRPGVPPDLTRAALRRAWSTDPAIRDFVGLVENGVGLQRSERHARLRADRARRSRAAAAPRAIGRTAGRRPESASPDAGRQRLETRAKTQPSVEAAITATAGGRPNSDGSPDASRSCVAM